MEIGKKCPNECMILPSKSRKLINFMLRCKFGTYNFRDFNLSPIIWTELQI